MVMFASAALVAMLVLSASAQQGTIGIIVNEDLWPSVSSAVQGYAEDVQRIENRNVWICSGTFNENSSMEEMKDTLREQYENSQLEGVVLIGDLPIVMFDNSAVLSDEAPPSEFVCDLYFMDLDGSWSGSGGLFTSHTGNREAEIWVSRIIASVLTRYFDDEPTMVNDYFARVKSRMHGQDDIDPLYVIAGQYWAWNGLERENMGDLPYTTENTDAYRSTEDESASNRACGAQYMASLEEGREYAFVYSHSAWTSHAIGVSITDQRDRDFNLRFVNSFACFNADISRTNMCGAYALSKQGLVCVGSAKSGSMRPGSFGAYNEPLGEGRSFGDAFRLWFNDEGLRSIGWHYGMNLQGVGTLKVPKYDAVHIVPDNKRASVSAHQSHEVSVLVRGTSVEYSIPQLYHGTKVLIRMVTLQGKTVWTHVDASAQAGNNSIALKGASLLPGLYVCELCIGGVKKTISAVIR